MGSKIQNCSNLINIMQKCVLACIYVSWFMFQLTNVTFSMVDITFLTAGQFLDHVTMKSKTVPQSKNVTYTMENIIFTMENVTFTQKM